MQDSKFDGFIGNFDEKEGFETLKIALCTCKTDLSKASRVVVNSLKSANTRGSLGG